MRLGRALGHSDPAADALDGNYFVAVLGRDAGGVGVGAVDDLLGAQAAARGADGPAVPLVARLGDAGHGRVRLQVDAARHGQRKEVHDQLVRPVGVGAISQRNQKTKDNLWLAKAVAESAPSLASSLPCSATPLSSHCYPAIVFCSAAC